MTETHTVTATLWLWTSANAPASWHFLTIEGEAAEAINALALIRQLEFGRKRGWGSMKVSATIGGTTWQTSIFPDRSSGAWLLPVKAAVRKAEGLATGSSVKVSLTV